VSEKTSAWRDLMRFLRSLRSIEIGKFIFCQQSAR